MHFTDADITRIAFASRMQFKQPVRIQITAGYGCTVLEVFSRDYQPLQKIPLERILL